MRMVDDNCEICGRNQGLDRHHVVLVHMGGSKNPSVQNASNILTLCRDCHRNLHEGRWQLIRSPKEIRITDTSTGAQVMRRLTNPGLDVSSLLQLLNVAEGSLSDILEALPYFSDEQLVEAYEYAGSLGKRSWLVQAAILYEAQKRSIYGEQTLEAVARRFSIGLRQAQKYALVWKTLFSLGNEEESVNIDAIMLDEPSWYVVATTETSEPEKWLAYAQDRKAGDPRYSVAGFRRDIQIARFTQGVAESKELQRSDIGLPILKNTSACPWIKLLCVRSGTPMAYRDCVGCEFEENLNLRNEPKSGGY